MNADLESKLQKGFSFMAQNRVDGERNTYRRYGCQCSDGWYHLIRDMCQSIADRYAVEQDLVDLIPMQLKEKFATLRFYYAFEDSPYHIAAFDSLDGTSIRFEPCDTQDERKKKIRHDIAQIVHTYEKKSSTVCEFCGNMDSACIRMDMRWKKTLCNTCYENYLTVANRRPRFAK